MSANYLRAFGESVADVPADLERWFRGMRELDERAHALQVELEGDCEKQLRLVMEAAAGEGEGGAPGSKRLKTNSQRAGPADEGEKGATAQGNFQELNEEYMGRIEKATAELLKISAEKTGIAQQMYDCVDQHIRKLDRDLRAFDTEIANERVRLGLQPAEPAGDEKRRKRREVGSQQSSEELYKAALAAANASEPTYCTCKRISFGEMIGCENPDCQIEWFHFECVGLTDETRPKGKWYCKDCRKLLGKK